MILSTTDDDLVTPPGPTFKIFSTALKAFEKDIDGNPRKFLSCTASSTIEDLHGDRMTEDCVQGMAPQAKSKGMTIFLNHSYKVPEDVFGKTMDAKIVQRAANADGKPIYDLDLEIMLNEGNPRAVDTYAAIKDQGMKLGVSIGAMIEDYDFIDEDAGFWGGLEIKSVNLLEASIVGIPANQRSWVVNGLTALGAPKAVINKALGKGKTEPVQLAAPVEEPKNVTENVTEPGDEPDPGDDIDASASPQSETQDEETPSGETADEARETTADAAPAAAEAVAKLKSAGADESMLEILLSFLEGATDEVASLRKDLAAITAERDELRQDVQRAAEIVETIAKTPLGRKAQFVAPVSDFRTRFAGYYDEGFLKLLEGDEPHE